MNLKEFDFQPFRNNLNNLIKASGLSKSAFATETGLTPPTISRYINGQRTPDLGELMKIATYCNVSLDWLLGVEHINSEKSNIPIIKFYSQASEDDKRIIDSILNKYKE